MVPDDDPLLRRYWTELTPTEQANHIRNLMAQASAKLNAESQRQIETAQQQWLQQQNQQQQQRQQAAQEAKSQPRQSVNEALQKHYGLDRLGKGWDKARLADAHYAIDLGEMAVREGVIRPDELTEMRKALVMDNIGAMPPDQYAPSGEVVS